MNDRRASLTLGETRVPDVAHGANQRRSFIGD